MSLVRWLERLPNGVGWFFGGVYVVSQTAIGFVLGPRVGPDLVKMQLAFSTDAFRAVVGNWSVEDLVRFKNHFYLDFVHPLWYGVFLAFLLARVLPPGKRQWVWLAPVAMACDCTENIIHAIPAFAGEFTSHAQPWIAIAASFAAIKWSLALVGLVLVIYFGIRKLLVR